MTLRDERSSIRVTLSKINNFDHKTKKQSDGCPLTPHTRQNAPRTLDPMISKAYLDAAVIIRAGIPCGDDVSMPYASLMALTLTCLPADHAIRAETMGRITHARAEKQAAKPRGLLFVCYLSCISMGFFLLHSGFANNEFFPIDRALLRRRGEPGLLMTSDTFD